jgi:hypothetical protein
VDNLDRAILRLARGCLIYAVDVNTGEIVPFTQKEFLARESGDRQYIPHTDARLANARSAAIKAGHYKKEMAS